MHSIVIPYRKNNSGELKTCLALIKKNVPHKDIFVIDDFNTRTRQTSHVDQILKLKFAIENYDISEDFYLYNDDFFVLEPIQWTPYYHRGTLQEHIETSYGKAPYIKTLKKTAEYLGYDALSYELHIPFLMNKHKLAALIEELEPVLYSGDCPLIRSAYGNEYKVGGYRMDDVKNPKNYEGMTYVSTNEMTFGRKLGRYIRSKV